MNPNRMTKNHSLLFFILAVFFSFTAFFMFFVNQVFAEEVTTLEGFIFDTATGTITGYTGTSVDIIIPSVIRNNFVQHTLYEVIRYAKLDGLILLGAYPINDADIPTIAIYGSEDMGLDEAKLAAAQVKYEILGGNHAYFGNYGEQKGDGTASITRDSQQEQAVITSYSIHYTKLYDTGSKE